MDWIRFALRPMFSLGWASCLPGCLKLLPATAASSTSAVVAAWSAVLLLVVYVQTSSLSCVIGAVAGIHRTVFNLVVLTAAIVASAVFGKAGLICTSFKLLLAWASKLAVFHFVTYLSTDPASTTRR